MLLASRMLCLPLVMLFANSVAAQESPTSAGAVLERYVEALGGEMLLQSLEAVEFEGTIDSAGTPGTFTFLYAQEKCAMTVNLSGRPVVRLGFDGEYLWQKNGSFGFKRPADRFVGLGVDLPGTPISALEWLERKDQTTLHDSAVVDERRADVVQIEMPEGQVITGFFDRESGLLVQAIYGEGDTATEYRLQYAAQPLEGLRFVNKATASVAGTPGPRFVWTVDNIVVNPQLDREAFRMPEGLGEVVPVPDEDDKQKENR